MAAAAPQKHEEELIEALEQTEALGQHTPAPAIADLVEKGDADSLIELGAAYRAGTPFVNRDLAKAIECFEAAASLGHAEAEYLVGLARFSGLGVAKDQAEGATRLRAAAQKGSLRAKVYIANLYEIGVHFAPDKEKADVWYRNVARAANIEDAPESDLYVMSMADVGCVRYCLRLVADQALPAKERTFYLKKAKAMGYAQKLADHKRASATPPEPSATLTQPASTADVQPEKKAEPDAEKKAEPDKKAEADKKPEPQESLLAAQWTIGPGILAFVASSFFAAASSFAAFLSTEGARAMAAAGHPLPFLGERFEIVTFATVAALGVAPAAGLYRARIISIATVLGTAAAAGGWFLYTSVHLLPNQLAQTGAFGWGVFLLALLILGVLGGTRAKAPPLKKKLPRASKAPI